MHQPQDARLRDISAVRLATQTEFRAMEDRLRLQFGFGWASGDQRADPAGWRAEHALAHPLGLPTLPGCNRVRRQHDVHASFVSTPTTASTSS